MAGFVSKQPNGKYCRFSTIVDCPTHINMKFDDYVKVVEDMQHLTHEFAIREAQDVIDNYLRPFSEVINRYIPNNMSERMFLETIKKMVDKNGLYEMLDLDTLFERNEFDEEEFNRHLKQTCNEAREIVNRSITH